MKKLLLFLFCIPFLGITQNSHTINTVGSTFSPSSLTVNVGDTVNWNNTGGSHNVNATQVTFPNNPEGFGNSVGAGWTFQWIFTMAGTYDYQCDPHAPGMSGVIIANAPPQPLTYVPDSAFEAYLENNGMGDGIADNDSVLTANINMIDSLIVDSLAIADLSGIEGFTSLLYLDCHSNQLTSLDLSYNTALISLICYNNQLTSLDVSANTALITLQCYHNQLTSLNVSNNTALTSLNCNNNQLTSLDVSNNTSLEVLGCTINQLTSLDLRNGNNINMWAVWTNGNPNLYCIDVDDVAWSTANWTVANGSISSTMSFSTNCSWIPAENLFFSEYGEGSSDNKYFEIYNPTSDTVDLTNYAFARVSNAPTNIGVYEFWNDFDSGAVILPFDVYIVADQDADSMILAQADMAFGSLSNGDDGFALVYGINPGSPMSHSTGGYEILDWIGEWNGDPGQGWDVAGVGAATRNHTLVRKCPISQGDTSWTSAAGTDPINSQWIVLANNYWNNIGAHTFNTSVYDSLSFTICNGLSVIVGSNTYDSTGVYTDILIAANGCDSVVITDLTVLTSAASVIVNDITICNGDSILVDSNYYYISGTYIDTLQNTVGCDSIITTNLTVQTPVNQSVTICLGDSVVVGTSVYHTSGNYSDTLVSSIGCDSIIYTEVIVYSQFNSIFGGVPNNLVATGGMFTGNRSLILSCQLPSKIISTVVYSADTNLITFELRNANGIVIKDTTHQLLPGEQRVILNFELSAGNNYQIGVQSAGSGLYRNNSGATYPYQLGALATITGTTSNSQSYYYFYYNIEIQQSSQPTNYSICDGESITVGGSVYNTTGLYTDSLTSSLGCDSIVLTNLIVNPNIAFTNNQTICIGETYTINGNTYDTTGTYVDSLQTIEGCDSIITTNLTILSISAGSSINNQTICIGDSIMLGTSTYFMTGTYYDTLISSNSCDSIVTTNLIVQTANYASVNGGILDTVNGPGAFSNYNGHLLLDASVITVIKSANVYALDTNIITFELRDSSGLVLESVTHTVYPGIQNLNFNFTLPIGTDYQLGINGGFPGLYRGNADTTIFAYPFISGPVSVTSSVAGDQYYYFYYDIEFMPLSSYNEVNLCSGDSLMVGSNVYSTAGQYTDVLVANNFCDSIVVTVLEFYQSPQLSITSSPSPAEICLGETILLEGSAGFTYYWWDNDSIGSILTDAPTQDTWYLLSAKDSNDCVVKKDIWVLVDSCITGLDDLGFEEGGFQVYPNPASEQLTIDFAGNATSIQVYNMLGELVIEKHITEGKSSVQLFVKEWKVAMYSMQLYRKNGTITNKVFTVVK